MIWTRREKLRVRKLIARWSFLTAGLIALFWTIWYLATGSVPEVYSIEMAPDCGCMIDLPFAISRWWDILLGPISSVTLVLFFTIKISTSNEDITAITEGLSIALFFGLVAGLAAALFGLVSAMGLVLVFGLAAEMVCGLAVGLVYGLDVGRSAGLVVGVAYGLAVGVAYGLAVGLFFMLILELVGGLVYLLCSGRVRKWLFVKE